MKNKIKKGFTLIELMAVIVIISIFIFISTIAYIKIKNNIDKKNYENNIELIKTAAIKYTENTNIRIVFIQELIENGYLDKEMSNLINPDKKSININCYIAKVTSSKGILYADVIEKSITKDDGVTCDYNAKNQYNDDVRIIMETNDSKEEMNTEKTDKYIKRDYWTNEDVKLRYVLSDKINKDTAKIEWYRGLEKLNDTGESILVNNQELIQQLYTLKVTTIDEDGKEIKYETSVYVRIDKNKPVFESDIFSPKEDVWSQNKTYQVNASDKYSGLWGYIFVDESENCPTNLDKYTKNNKYLFKENKKIKTCIADYAGNIAEKVIEVNTVDTSAPTCGDITGSSTTWTNSNRTITQACNDTGGSGCNQETYVKTYASSIKTDTITIKDNAGNETKCTYNVYVDKIAPTCGDITGASTTWTTSDRTIKQTCNDTGGSGCNQQTYVKTYASSIKTDTITIKDNAGNATQCSYNVYIDKTAPTCASSGGSDNWKNTNITITGTCSDSLSGCKGNASQTYTSNINGSYSPGRVYDKVGNYVDCPKQTVKIDKTAPTCISSGGSSSWTNSNITITGICQDTGGSGCKGNTSQTYTSNTNGSYSPGKIYDNAGNYVECGKQTVKIDKTAPTIQWGISGNTATMSCTDSGGSGLSTASSNSQALSGASNINVTWSCTDNAGNTTNSNHIYRYNSCISTYQNCYSVTVPKTCGGERTCNKTKEWLEKGHDARWCRLQGGTFTQDCCCYKPGVKYSSVNTSLGCCYKNVEKCTTSPIYDCSTTTTQCDPECNGGFEY